MRVKSYASSMLFGTPDEVSKEALQLVTEGHDQIKLKVGMDEDDDVRNVKAIREAIGFDVDLMVDANSAYSAARAIRVGREFEKYECFWFEEPVPPDDVNGYAEVAKALDIPIAAGESHFSRYDFRDLILQNAVDIVMPDIGRVGGVSEAKKISVLASTFGKGLSPHVGLCGAGVRAAAIHFAATLPKEISMPYEYYQIRNRPNPLAIEIVEEQVERFDHGYVSVSSKPGLGINLDENVLASFLCDGWPLH